MDRSRQYWDIVFFLIDTLDRLNVAQMNVGMIIGGRIRRAGGDRLGNRIVQARSETHARTRAPQNAWRRRDDECGDVRIGSRRQGESGKEGSRGKRKSV